MHEKELFAEALKGLMEKSKKRKFDQSVDMIITLKSIDLKKATNHREFFVKLPKAVNKKVKVCAFVGPETLEQAKKTCDKVITVEEFDKYAKDKKLIKKLARDYDVFIAQMNIMPKVASAFGRVLAPRGKMPNPKSGGVFPPKVDLKSLSEKLRSTIKINVKKSPMIQLRVGTESMKEEDIIDNAVALYEAVIHNLPNEKNNIKKVMLKLTMSAPVRVI